MIYLKQLAVGILMGAILSAALYGPMIFGG